MRSYFKSILLLYLCMTFGNADDVEIEVQSSLMLKMLRDMSNQTQADSLNLPANASSIRQNITDTFSCENKTYGYYADVDNECQLFHVCLPSQTPSGRNVTYKWSFICPNETVFNQEVLVCTRPADSIPCEDSPNYYDLNMEIGKEQNTTKETNEKQQKKTQKRKSERKPDRKQVLLEKLMEEIAITDINDRIDDNDAPEFEQIIPILDIPNDKVPETEGSFPKDVEFVDEVGKEEFPKEKDVEFVDVDGKVDLEDGKVDLEDGKVDLEDGKEEERLAMERSMARNSKRASFRFKADV